MSYARQCRPEVSRRGHGRGRRDEDCRRGRRQVTRRCMETARKGDVAKDLRELAMDAPGGRAWLPLEVERGCA